MLIGGVLLPGEVILLPILPDQFDRAHDVIIQFVQFLGRNPPFGMMLGPDTLDGIPLHEILGHEESRDEACA